jgi:hypothetical protein
MFHSISIVLKMFVLKRGLKASDSSTELQKVVDSI